MTRRWMRYSQWFLAVAVVLLTPVLVLADPPSAGKQLRFKLSLVVTGNYQHTGPKTIPQGAMHLTVKQAIDNGYSTEYVVVSDQILTGLQKVNRLDPASQQEMADYNTKVKEQADRVYHSADHLRKPGMGGSARPGGMVPGMMDMGRMQEMQQKIMACGNDQACKQRIAMEMMSQQRSPMPSSGSGAQVQADIQAISDACINKGNKMGSKGYEQCMDAEGEKRSTVKRSAADNEAEVPELPDRYLLYSNLTAEKHGDRFMDCQYKAHAKVNESGTYGSISDGEGGGQYGEASGTTKGEGDFKQKPEMVQFNMTPCTQAEAVFDTKNNLFWGGFISMGEPEFVQTGAQGGQVFGSRVDRNIEGWVKTAMQGVPASGTKTQKFGYQTATLTWSITRE
jgi:hypothetical protein